MRLRRVASVLLCLCFASVLVAQAEHKDPISGTWFGYYGTNPGDQMQVPVALSWEGKVLMEKVTKGENPTEFEIAKFEFKTEPVLLKLTLRGRGNLDYH